MARARLGGSRTRTAKLLANFVGSGRGTANLSAVFKAELTASPAKKKSRIKKR
jgi:hypothetical protein